MQSTGSIAAMPRTLDVRKTVICGLLIACGVILGLVESWFVAWSPAPWMRLGLANVVVVVALAMYGPREALTVSLSRVLLVGVATGTLAAPSGLLATTGAVLSVCTMVILARYGERFSVVGWSAAGAAAHTVGQFVAAALLAGSPAVLLLLPLSALASLALGVATGSVARVLLSRVVPFTHGGRAHNGATIDQVCT